MKRGTFTPPAASPKSSAMRNQVAMSAALARVAKAIENYNKVVWAARNLQARHIVDALYARYDRQFKSEQTTLSFGEWLVAKETLPNTYAKLGIDTVLWIFDGIFVEALNDKRFLLFGEKELGADWLTPLIDKFINKRVTETDFKVRAISVKTALLGFRYALASLDFKKQRVVG